MFFNKLLGHAFGQGGVWAALLISSLKISPAVPWCAVVMAFVLWLMWNYLSGKWWPRSTSDARRRYLRANPASGRSYAWTFLAGILSITALTGYWIVFFSLVRMQANVLPDLSKYPLITLVLVGLWLHWCHPSPKTPSLAGIRRLCLAVICRVPRIAERG